MKKVFEHENVGVKTTITYEDLTRRNKIRQRIWNIFSFIFAFFVCGTAFEFTLNYFFFGFSFDRKNLTYSIAEAAGLAVGYLIFNGVKTVVEKIRFRKKG